MVKEQERIENFAEGVAANSPNGDKIAVEVTIFYRHSCGEHL